MPDQLGSLKGTKDLSRLTLFWLFVIDPKIFIKNPDGTDSAAWIVPKPVASLPDEIADMVTAGEATLIAAGSLYPHVDDIQRNAGQTDAQLLAAAREKYAKLDDPVTGIVAGIRREYKYYGRRFDK